jgi:RNA polymerase sigma-70 factor, ECF subfamily
MSTVTAPDTAKHAAGRDFERVYREYAPLAYRTAWAVLGSREDAEDVLQTIFLKLLRSEFPPDLQQSPKAYFYRAALNASLDVLKARRRRPVLVPDADVVDLRASSTVFEFDEDMSERLYDAISRLSADAAAVVVLRYMHNKSTEEISTMLGVSRTVVGVRLFRARSRLRKLLRSGVKP